MSLFGTREDHEEWPITLDGRFIKNRSSSFFFKHVGTSMSPTIMDGDVLVVDRSIEIDSGMIAVFEFRGEFICKRYFKDDLKITLVSDNRKCKDLVLSLDDELRLFGVVVASVRDHLGVLN